MSVDATSGNGSISGNKSQHLWLKTKNKDESDENVACFSKCHLQKILWQAVQSRSLDPEIVKNFVAHEANIYSRNKAGETILSTVARHGVLNLVKYSIEQCPYEFDRNDGNTLNSAVQSGSLEIVEYFVEECDANVNSTNECGETALHYAVAAGSIFIVKYLVEHGADVNSRNNHGTTILHSALSYKSKVDMVKYLVEHGAGINFKDSDGETALHTAAVNCNLEVVKYLVEQGADLYCQNKDGSTALELAVSYSSKCDLAKYLFEQSADVNSKINFQALLPVALAQDDDYHIKYFVKHGANVNEMDTNGDTPLHLAILSNNLHIVKYLVENGSDVNGRNAVGQTALHLSASQGEFEIFRYLVKNGSNVNGRDADGNTVLHTAVVNSCLDIVMHLVEQGANVNSKNNNGKTILHVAEESNVLGILKYLIQQGADISKKSMVDDHSLGINILKMAIVQNSVDLAKVLIEKNVNVKNSGEFLVKGRRMNFLEWSIHLGHEKITALLKMSVKHREKMEALRTMNSNQFEKVILCINGSSGEGKMGVCIE